MHVSRIVFAAFVAWGASIFWMSSHPPMVDFPQHAAQVTLLRELVSGTSPWSSMLQVNLVTPYLIGYGSAFLLSYVMPVTAALKLLVSTAYVFFVIVCIRMRQRVDADPRLDWLFIPTYFGLCYSWGLLTFLLAAPIGIYFMLRADKYATEPTPRQATILVLLGLLLLVSHGMTFVLGWGAAVLLLLFRSPKNMGSLRRAWPLVLLLVAGYVFYKAGKQLDATLIRKPTALFFGDGLFKRFKDALQYPFSFGFEIGTREHLIPVVIAIGLVPFLLKLRIAWRNPTVWVPFVSVCILFFGLPDTADNTALLFQRFSLFLLPAFVWLFSARAAVPGAAPAPQIARTRTVLAEVLMIGCCVFILGSASLHAWRFGQETRGFDSKVRQLDPEQRAVGLIFDDSSIVANSALVYVHYAAWYQAEKKGLTDFNFAWYTPQIVRYRSGASPPISIGFEWTPERFDWVAHHGERYRYFFVRGKKTPENIFRTFPCMPKRVIQDGLWNVYENCAQETAQGPVASSR